MMNKYCNIGRASGLNRHSLFSFVVLGLILFVASSSAEAQSKRPMPPTNAPEGVEFYDNEGHEHLPENSISFFKTDPPTSGPHDPRWLPPSVYEANETRPELLVHNLEHGNIVIYFNRSSLSKEEIKWLTELTRKYIGQWDGVLMVTRDDKEHPLVLAAWRTILRLKSFEKETVLQFVDAFRGRGPENPVR